MIVAEFQARFPQFAATIASTIQLWLDDALLELGTIWDCFPARKKLAQGLIAAHYGATIYSVAGSTGPSGPVTSQKVGDLSENYAQNSTPNKNDFSNTNYGQAFLRLQKQTVISFRVV